MEYIFCLILGYGLGCLSPSYALSKMKHRDIRNSGTGNLGTTNTFINFGKKWGFFVLLFDMLKAFVAVRICQGLYPDMILAGAIGGSLAVVGHIFPFYTGFHGGKGIASFGGFILAAHAPTFVLLLIIGCILALIFNYGCSISFSAAILFPVLYAYQLKSIVAFLILSLCSAVIIWKHMDNIKKIKNGKEMKIRIFLSKHVFERGTTYGKE